MTLPTVAEDFAEEMRTFGLEAGAPPEVIRMLECAFYAGYLTASHRLREASDGAEGEVRAYSAARLKECQDFMKNLPRG